MVGQLVSGASGRRLAMLGWPSYSRDMFRARVVLQLKQIGYRGPYYVAAGGTSCGQADPWLGRFDMAPPRRLERLHLVPRDPPYGYIWPHS